MWEWRDETTRGQWRLDGSGSWIWDEPSLLERVGLAPASFGPGSVGAPWSPPEPWSPAPWSPPESWSPSSEPGAHPSGRWPDPWTDTRARTEVNPRTDAWSVEEALVEETPIFEAVAEDHGRDDGVDRRRRHGAPEGVDEEGHPGATDRVEYRTAPWIPEPSPGSGPFPAQGGGLRSEEWAGAPGGDGWIPDADVSARHARSPYDDGHDAEYADQGRGRAGGRHTLRR